MKFLSGVATILLAVSSNSFAWAAPSYSIVPLGLDDAEHTNNLDKIFSEPTDLNEAGQVTGQSTRYDGNAYLGESAWLNDGNTTVTIGFTGVEHTRDDGYKYSYALSLNDAGQATGYSRRYAGSTDMGRSAWLYEGATTVELGLIDSEHTRTDGYRYSDVSGGSLSESGQVIGASRRYAGSTDMGWSTWLYDGITTFDIGLTGLEHTRNDGYKYSRPRFQNQAGQVIGFSERYVGSIFTDGVTSETGRSVWLYNGTTTIDVGFTGPEYTTNNGYKKSFLGQSKSLNDTGQVIGYSMLFDGGTTARTHTAWFYNGTATIEIGLSGPEHTNSDGYSFNESYELNNAGQVIGHSRRYSDGNFWGQSAWLYDGTKATEIGLTGPEHTSGLGYRYSETFRLNEAGQVLGRSYRFDGGNTQLGTSVWLYDGTTTKNIGPTDAEYINNDGDMSSSAFLLSEAGYVAGTARRYYGDGTQHAVDTWLYDPELDQTIALPIPRRSDGHAWSSIAYLGEDGLVLGYYNVYNPNGSLVGDRAFYFTVVDGFHVLGDLVESGLDTYGWHHLAEAVRANELGQIIGFGHLTYERGSRPAYLLTPLSGLEGDYNNDGTVDAADYTVWRNAFAGVGSIKNESASLGVVDEEDYQAWKDNYGAPNNGSGGISGSTSNLGTVPEPITITLLLFAIIMLITSNRHRI